MHYYYFKLPYMRNDIIKLYDFTNLIFLLIENSRFTQGLRSLPSFFCIVLVISEIYITSISMCHSIFSQNSLFHTLTILNTETVRKVVNI